MCCSTFKFDRGVPSPISTGWSRTQPHSNIHCSGGTEINTVDVGTSGGGAHRELFLMHADDRPQTTSSIPFERRGQSGVLHWTAPTSPIKTHITVATSFRWSLRFCLIKARSSGSKNASSIAYVHVPRSRRPKRTAGLSKSLRGCCCSISVNNLMVI